MKTLLAITALIFSATAAEAKSFTLDPVYLRGDGAIYTYLTQNSVIDPYFATKALLTASDAGMDISGLAHGWIAWMLPRQEKNGLFSRFCAKDSEYAACMKADADDAMMAMWIDLLYRMSPESGIPVAWRGSLDKALTQLEALYDKNRNVYVISSDLPVGLLMDNVEIYASLKRAGTEAARIGDIGRATAFHARAARLKNGITDIFWDSQAQRFRITTQARNDDQFYPDRVAQIIPMLHGFRPHPLDSDAKNYAGWMQQYQQQWMALIGKEYPWGLVAVVAAEQGDMLSANCWLSQAASQRHSTHWTVLEEAAYQSVELKTKGSGASDACAKVVS